MFGGSGGCGRRMVVAGAAGLWAAPLVRLRAQTPASPFRVGFAHQLRPQGREHVVRLMGDQGWVLGRDWLMLESGIPPGAEVELAAARIVAERPDVIVVSSDAYALAVRRLTDRTPIVMVSGGYPVEAGLAFSLAHPGKNVTGNSTYAGTGIWGKLLQLLRESKAGVRRIGLLWDYVPPMFTREEGVVVRREIRDAGRALDLELHFGELAAQDGLPAALALLESRQVQALLSTSGPSIWPARSRVMAFAIERRWPTIVDFPWVSLAGPQPMITYAPVFSDLMRQAIEYVVRILKGAKPGELPITLPMRYELQLDLKTAAAIGLTVPQSLRLRATSVIE